jgi:hypothetical protein
MNRKSNAELEALRFRAAVLTRARQIARAWVKEELRACGKRPEHYTCAMLTRLAEARMGLHLKQAAEDIAEFVQTEKSL